MFCRQCGSELDGKSKFCSKCGTSTRTDADYKSNSSQSNMQTREELVNGLQNVIRLMKQATALKESSAATIKKQVYSKTPRKEIAGAAKAVFTATVGIVSFLIFRKIFGVFNLALLNHYGNTAWMPLPVQLFYYVISVVIPIAVAVTIAIFFCKKVVARLNSNIREKNIAIINENQKIAAYNQSIRQEAENINRRLREIQLEYQNTVMTWYPPNYCYIEAVEFFLDCVTNYRADTLKEAINLYEEYLHRERVERNQEAMLKKQDLNNLLTLGSVIMQGQVLSAVQQNTSAVHEATSAVHGVAAEVEKNTNAVKGLYR